MEKKICVLITLLTMFFFEPSRAQEQRDTTTQTPKKLDLNAVKEKKTPPLQATYTHAKTIDSRLSLPNYALNSRVLQYDPARKGDVGDHATLGNLGTPSRPLVFSSLARQGFDVGLHQFDLYKLPLDSLRFYRTNKTLTDLFFSQGSLQDNFIFKSMLTRNLGERSNLALDYQRISHEGYYRHHKSRHTALGINSSFSTKNNRYTGFIAFVFNEMKQENNGGIRVDTLFKNELYQNRFNIPVYSQSAFTQQRESAYAYTHHYKLTGAKPDSTQTEKRQFLLAHQVAFKTFAYKFFDEKLDQDSALYKHFQVDNRGLRHFVEGSTLSNHFWVSTFKHKKTNNSAALNDRLTVGIKHEYHALTQEPRDTNMHTLFLTANVRYAPKQIIIFSAEGHLGILGQVGDYHLTVSSSLDFGRLGNFKFHFLNESYSPNLLQQRFIISQKVIWENNFQKTFRTQLGGNYHLPSLPLSLGITSQLLNGYIYYDTLGYARQTNKGVGILQLYFKNNLTYGHFHAENTLYLQRSTYTDVLRLPLVFGKHSLYYENTISNKKMLYRLGADLRYATRYQADAYNALTGQFQLSEKMLDFYPAVDVFAGFKVGKLMGFFRLENALDWLLESQFYTTPKHPMPDGVLRFETFRLGLVWRFEDEFGQKTSGEGNKNNK